MMDNDKDIDSVTSGWLKNLPLDEPSDNFSSNVMNSIYSLESKKSDDNINYWWFLLLIPVLIAGGWYLSTIPEYAERMSKTWMALQEYYYSLNSGFGSFFSDIKDITISPFVILIFLAVLSLLVIEDIFSKSRQKLRTEKPF